MNIILNTLKQKKLQFVFLFYILLLLPLLSPLAENLSFLDKTAIFLVCGLLFSAILVLSLFISPKLERFIYSILLIISIIPGAIYLAYLLFARVLLEQNSVKSLFETTPEESKEFIAYYLSIWVIVGVLIYTSIPIVMICLMRSCKRLSINKNKILFTSSLIIIFTIVGFGKFSRSVYFINFYKTLISYKLQTNYEIKAIKERQLQEYDVTLKFQDTVPQTIVVVIAESLNKHHMSIYGYQRTTNPLLSQLEHDNLYIYNDIVSPQVHTIPVMRSVLSMSEGKKEDCVTAKPTLFELFNRAGYDTYIISNQGFSEDYRSSFDVLLTQAKYKYDLSALKQHDDIILPKLEETLITNKKKNKLIVLHLISNHMAYEFRYPKEYIVFDYKKDNLVEDRPHRDALAKKTIDKYDNSVLFNDYVINSIISKLSKSENEKSVMIYFSDHGEEMYDYRDFAGHAYEKVSPKMCEIPFLVWMSDSFKNSRSDLVFEINRPYSSSDFIFSLSDIAGLAYKDYDDSRSLFSNKFVPQERYVGEKKYEDIKHKFENN